MVASLAFLRATITICSEGGDWWQWCICLVSGKYRWTGYFNGSDITAPFTPLITYTGADCSSLALQPSLAPCFQGTTATVGAGANQSYWIKIEAANGEDLGDFDLCVATFFNTFDCYDLRNLQLQDRNINSRCKWPYCPGETINFCFFFVFTVSSVPPQTVTTVQWIQGIIPTLYGGYELYNQSQFGWAKAPPEWIWLDEDEVDYNVNSSIYSIVTIDGRKGLAYGGPSAGMPAGTLCLGMVVHITWWQSKVYKWWWSWQHVGIVGILQCYPNSTLLFKI